LANITRVSLTYLSDCLELGFILGLLWPGIRRRHELTTKYLHFGSACRSTSLAPSPLRPAITSCSRPSHQHCLTQGDVWLRSVCLLLTYQWVTSPSFAGPRTHTTRIWRVCFVRVVKGPWLARELYSCILHSSRMTWCILLWNGMFLVCVCTYMRVQNNAPPVSSVGIRLSVLVYILCYQVPLWPGDTEYHYRPAHADETG